MKAGWGSLQNSVTGDTAVLPWPEYNFILILCKQQIQEKHRCFKTYCCKEIESTVHCCGGCVCGVKKLYTLSI